MRVRDWMSPDPVTVGPDTPVAEARSLLAYYGVRHLPVVDRGRVAGMISDRDVRVDEAALQRMAARLAGASQLPPVSGPAPDRAVSAVMSSPAQVIHADESVEAAARLMLSRRISALPVLADDVLVGVITTTDCLLALLTPDRGRAAQR